VISAADRVYVPLGTTRKYNGYGWVCPKVPQVLYGILQRSVGGGGDVRQHIYILSRVYDGRVNYFSYSNHGIFAVITKYSV
jgi:hypothetical protein